LEGSSTWSGRNWRALLIYHDRLDGVELPLTHEFVAITLGRAGPCVTEAPEFEAERIVRAHTLKVGSGSEATSRVYNERPLTAHTLTKAVIRTCADPDLWEHF
jgi:hypothetical protein